MMSAAVAMMIGVDQASSNPVAAEQSESQGMSFADSLGGHIDLREATGKNETSVEAPGLSGTKNAESFENFDEATIASQQMPYMGNADRLRFVPVNGDKAADAMTKAEGPAVIKDTVISDALRSRNMKEKPLPGDIRQGKVVPGNKVGPNFLHTGVAEKINGAEVNKFSADAAKELVEKPANAQNDLLTTKPEDLIPALQKRADMADQKTGILDQSEMVKTDVAPNAGALKEPDKRLDAGAEKKIDAKALREIKETGAEAVTVPAVQGYVSLVAHISPTSAMAQSAGKTVDRGPDIAERISEGMSRVGSVKTGSLPKQEIVSNGKVEIVEASEGKESAGLLSAMRATGETGEGSSKESSAVTRVSKDVDVKTEGTVPAAGMTHATSGNDGATGIVIDVASHELAIGTELKMQSGDADVHASSLQSGMTGHDVNPGAVDVGAEHRTLLVTPTTLEVGLPNGSQGWLKIRAEMESGGTVNTSLSSTTSAGQEMLHRELPGLTAYLHEERVAVNTVAVHTSSGAEPRLAGGMDGERGGSAQHGSQGDRQRQDVAETGLNPLEDMPARMDLQGADEDGSLPVGMYVGGGSWLNVRA